MTDYSEFHTSFAVEAPAILNPRSQRWHPSRGEPSVERIESPGYTMISQTFSHPNPGRNALGLVGGNEVSLPAGNIVDVESELYGITRSLTHVPAKQYRPSCPLGDNKCPSWPNSFQFKERSTGKERTISMKPMHLQTTQMFSYPGVPAPKPLVQQIYAPWRF